MVTALPLVLVTVTLWLGLVPPATVFLKVSDVLLSESGEFELPVPLAERATASGVPLLALSVITMAPLAVACVGCTWTLTVQLAFGLRAPLRHVPVFTT